MKVNTKTFIKSFIASFLGGIVIATVYHRTEHAVPVLGEVAVREP